LPRSTSAAPHNDPNNLVNCGPAAVAPLPYIVDVRQSNILHWIRFEGGVRELFDAAFIPGFRAPMCVGLGNPEMRTLITFDGVSAGVTAEATE
jgi:hypothetical protein